MTETERLADRGDAAAILQLLRAEDIASTGESSLSAAEIDGWFDSPRHRERSITRLVHSDERLVGVFQLFRNFDDKYSLIVAVDRELPDDEVDRLWTTGLARLKREALAVATGFGVTNPRAELWAHETDHLRRRHAEAAGFENVRTFIEMQLELAGYRRPPADPRVTVRQADLASDDGPDLRAMYDVITESFRDHFDFTLRPFPEWVSLRRDDPLADFDHWYLAEADGETVGALMGHDTYLEQDNAGYVAVLGVRRRGRGKGVAKSLLHTSFARYAAEGRAAVKLHVDADSPTGATHLYESVGMYRRLVGFDYHLNLAPDA